MNLYHYVYYSYEEWGRGYIGVRSCECKPEQDSSYFGSFKDKTFAPKNKIILATFETREEALQAEIDLHTFYQVHVNSHFANRSCQTSTGWSTQGVPTSGEVKNRLKKSHLQFRLNYPEREAHRIQMQREKTAKWREENPDKWLEICKIGALAAANIKKLNPKKTSEDARKGGMSTTERRKKDPDLDTKMRAAVSKATRLRWTPEYQQMLIQKSKESCSIPVIVIDSQGYETEFSSIKECALALKVSKGLISNKLKGLPTQKLKNITIIRKVLLPEPE